MNHEERRAKGRIIDNTPTMTDQSQAKDTDLNVIMKKYAVTGRVPGAPGQPIYGDFTNLPTDLRGMIEEARSIKERRKSLPPQLRDKPMEELLALTPEQLTTILTPPEQPAKPEEKK
ncbi:MAG: internal scaffolding protein [Arizlama microvirus]|nr:MAG: internal scaffolding protein [Arizlama microvirus]